MADMFMQNVTLVRLRLARVPNGIDPTIGELAKKLPGVLKLSTIVRKERALFVTDVPRDKSLEGDKTREDRLAMLARLKTALERLDVIVDGVIVHADTGENRAPLPEKGVLLLGKHMYTDISIRPFIREADIVIAATEFSATEPLTEMLQDNGRVYGRAYRL